eukprot:6190926-Pleurochrysis_carterae.AAC.1
MTPLSSDATIKKCSEVRARHAIWAPDRITQNRDSRPAKSSQLERQGGCAAGAKGEDGEERRRGGVETGCRETGDGVQSKARRAAERVKSARSATAYVKKRRWMPRRGPAGKGDARALVEEAEVDHDADEQHEHADDDHHQQLRAHAHTHTRTP